MIRIFLSAAVLISYIGDVEAIIIREELTPDLGEVAAPISPGWATDISVPPGTAIADYGLGDGSNMTPIRLGKSKVRILAGVDPKETNLNINLRDGRSATIRFIRIPGMAVRTSRVEFYEPGTMPRSLETVESDLGIGKWLAHAQAVDAPRDIHWRHFGDDLTLRSGFVVHTAEAVILPLELRTNGEPFPVAELQLTDEKGRAIDADLVYAEHELRARQADVNLDKPLLAAFRINKPHQIANGWTVTAVPVGRLAPARFSFNDRRRRGPLEGKLAVAVYALGGMASLDDGVGNNETAWAPMLVGGAQVTLGLKRNVSIQGAFDIARSDGVMFDDVAWDQDQGALQVDETAGRLSASGLFHTAGRRWVPYARLGLGVRLSKRETRLGSRSESEFRSGFFGIFGGGVNVLLGKRMMAGLSMGYTAPLGGRDTTEGFELGFALSGLWTMERD